MMIKVDLIIKIIISIKMKMMDFKNKFQIFIISIFLLFYHKWIFLNGNSNNNFSYEININWYFLRIIFNNQIKFLFNKMK